MGNLLLVKLIVVPLLVAGMSLAARRFGPTIGGLILGLPWMTGPVLFILGLERGEVYLAESARGALLAVPSIGAFAVTYAVASRHAGWPLSVLAAGMTFILSGWAMSYLDVAATWVALLATAALLAAHHLIPKPPAAPLTLGLPWWDIPARMLATAALVAFIAIAGDRLGPTLSGIASSYPVILTVVITFTHKRWGVNAAVTMLRGVMLSLIGFVMFFWVVACGVGTLGVVKVYMCAIAAGFSVNAGMIALNQWRVRAARLARETA